MTIEFQMMNVIFVSTTEAEDLLPTNAVSLGNRDAIRG